MSIRRARSTDDGDLSPIIQGLAAVKRSTRTKQANDEKTRSILDASMRLLDAHFSVPPPSEKDDESRKYPFFQWLSRAKIAQEIVAAEQPGSLTSDEERQDAERSWVRLLERRWTAHDSYIKDFLSYAITARHWSLQIALSQDTHSTLMGGLKSGHFPDAVHEVAFEDLRTPLADPGALRMQLVATVLAEREAGFAAALRDLYASVDDGWSALYAEIFAARGWKLRPELTFQHLTMMLSTAAEGMAMRALVLPDDIINFDTRRTLLGKLALAMVISCVDLGDGRTMEELAQTLLDAQPPTG